MNEPTTAPSMERSLGVWQATALNIANMVGIGPFMTIPAFIAAMQGPHAIIGWILAAILVLCDGLVWAELGAAMPSSGGTYHFLKVIFGRSTVGNVLPFLFIWQFLVSGALEMASGYVGALLYLEYAWPTLGPTLAAWHVPGGTRCVAVLAVLCITLLLCQRVGRIGILGMVLCTGTLTSVLAIIVCGLSNFNSALLVMPEKGIVFDSKFAMGLGAAMLIAIYDYLGYFNVCHLGDEVKDPGRTIPRAIIFSIGIIATLYLTMNVSIMGVIPWQDAMHSQNIAADFMEQLFGHSVAVAFSWLIIWTGLAGLFALTLAYSRIPYAAAKAGDFFRFLGNFMHVEIPDRIVAGHGNIHRRLLLSRFVDAHQRGGLHSHPNSIHWPDRRLAHTPNLSTRNRDALPYSALPTSKSHCLSWLAVRTRLLYLGRTRGQPRRIGQRRSRFRSMETPIQRQL